MCLGVQSRTAIARSVNQVRSDLAVTKISVGKLSGPQTSDYLLARAAARGVMTALGDLFERYSRRVYSVCLRMTHNSAEAEDLTQEVFLLLVRKIGSFRGESQFNTWLHRLTVNLVLMHLRHGATRRKWGPEDLEKKISIAQGIKAPPASQMTDKIALASAMEQLPPGCRSVFVLFDVAGYNHEEVSNLLGCSVGTSKSQLHRARVKLRVLLKSGKQTRTRVMPVASLTGNAYHSSI